MDVIEGGSRVLRTPPDNYSCARVLPGSQPAQAPEKCDIAIVGGGIVGLAVARELLQRDPRTSVCVLEREDEIGTHQTGHNSGVVHAGVYYQPGSLKARLCVEGARELYEYCGERGIASERCGKLIVATDRSELPRLEELERRGHANGVPGLCRIDAAGIEQIEPHARGIAGLHSPSTGIVNFPAVARAYAGDVLAAGGTVATACGVTSVETKARSLLLTHARGEIEAGHALFCAGAWSDRLAVQAGADPDPRIVPFRGAYLRLVPGRRQLVRSLIYPVPDPSLPFLGVHLTKHIDGGVLIGPTALIAGARDAYRLGRLRREDVLATLGWPGTWRMLGRWWRTGIVELRHTAQRSAFVRAAARYVPELEVDDVEPAFAGIRAQALGRDGRLVDDFVFSRTERALHVRNAPSPAATSSLAIARHVADEAGRAFGLTRRGVGRWPTTRLGPALVAALLAGVFACLLATPLTATAHSEPAWTTYHRDPARSGDDPEAAQPIEPALAWQTEDLGAPIWGQPLVLGSRVYVATVGDDVYALEATTGKVIWQQSAGTPVPAGELLCGDISPTVGIVSTPLIDTATGTIYVVADTWDAVAKEARHMLEGFDLQAGEPVLSTPVNPPGADPKTLLQRSALNLDEGEIVFGFGGNYGSCSEELAPVVAVPATGGPARFWQTNGASSPTTAGGLWATSGAAVDSAGDIYAATANPLPPEGEPITAYDYSDSVVKLSLADFVKAPKAEPLAELGWFEPPNWEFLSNHDLDLGSAGAELLPGGLLFQAGKDGTGYLIDEATMSSGAAAVYSGEVCDGHGSFGGDAYAAGMLYIPCTNGVQALAYEEAARSFKPLWQGPANAVGSPIVSGGLVWVVATGGFTGGGETLYGLDPTTGATRYAEALPSPVIDHFASPSAASGRLFVATGSSVTAYQLAAPSSAGAGSGNASPATGAGAPTTGTTSAPGGASTPNGQPAPAAGPTTLLLRKQLRVTANGNVRVALRCAAVTTGKCKGMITLIAEIAVTVHRGKRSVRRLIPFTLAHARFGPAAGDFIVTIHLDRSAEARLRRHGDRLALRVVLAASPGKTVSVVAVLR